MFDGLPKEVEDIIIGLVPQNDVACTLRLLDKATAARLSGAKFRVVKLSEPCPHQAFKHRWQAERVQSLSYRKRVQLLCLTASSGDVANLEAAILAVGCTLTAEVLEAAAGAGHLHICQALRQKQCKWGRSLAAASKAGHRHVCEWMLDNGCPLDPESMRFAVERLELLVQERAANGQIRFMKLLRQAGRQVCISIATAAGGDLAALQEALTWPPALSPWIGVTTWEEAGQAGRLLAAAAGSRTPDWQAKVEWLEDQGHHRTPTALRTAAARPDALERLRWLRQRGYPINDDVVVQAVHSGDLAVLQYLLDEAGLKPRHRGFGEAAATHGRLDMMQELLARGASLDSSRVVNLAAQGGHLHVVSWVFDTDPEGACNVLYHPEAPLMCWAAESGSVELLAWLKQHGADPSSGRVFVAAAESGCAPALEWLAQHGCEMPDDGLPFLEAARNGDLATLRCLRRLGCPWGFGASLFTDCVRAGSELPVLQWLVEAGCPVNLGRALRQARRRERPGCPEDLSTWLLRERRRQWRARRQALAASCRRKLRALFGCMAAGTGSRKEDEEEAE